MPRPQTKYFNILFLIALLLPHYVMASEPCGPGLDVLIILGMIVIGAFTGIVSLILLSIQPRARKAFNIFLVFNFILHIILLITWYHSFSDYDPKRPKLIAFLHNAFVHDDYGVLLQPAILAILIFWIIMSLHLWKNHTKGKNVVS